MKHSFASRYAGAFALAIALLLPSVLPGQENTGTILGIVTDDTGATVPDAKVEVTGSTLPRGLQTTSNGSGEYQFARVPIGTYSVTVSKTGFNTLKQQEVVIRPAEHTQRGDDPRLRGQQQRVAGLADAECLHVVGDHALQVVCGIPSGDADKLPRATNDPLVAPDGQGPGKSVSPASPPPSIWAFTVSELPASAQVRRVPSRALTICQEIVRSAPMIARTSVEFSTTERRRCSLVS